MDLDVFVLHAVFANDTHYGRHHQMHKKTTQDDHCVSRMIRRFLCEVADTPTRQQRIEAELAPRARCIIHYE